MWMVKHTTRKKQTDRQKRDRKITERNQQKRVQNTTWFDWTEKKNHKNNNKTKNNHKNHNKPLLPSVIGFVWEGSYMRPREGDTSSIIRPPHTSNVQISLDP
jgi:hypothetical protein